MLDFNPKSAQHMSYMSCILIFPKKWQSFSLPDSEATDSVDHDPQLTPSCGADEAWASLLHVMDRHDQELIQGWKDELANLLTFVSGLILQF